MPNNNDDHSHHGVSFVKHAMMDFGVSQCCCWEDTADVIGRLGDEIMKNICVLVRSGNKIYY